MQGYLRNTSNRCLKVRPYYVLNSTDPGVFDQFGEVSFLPSSVKCQCFEHDVHTDLVTKFEAVGQGFLGAVDFYRNVIDPMLLDSGFICFI